MKKFLAAALALVMTAAVLTGCGADNSAAKVKVIEIDLTQEEYAFGVDKTQPELLETVNLKRFVTTTLVMVHL